MALIPAAPSRVLAWAGEVDPASEDLYTNCPVGVDMAPGQFMAADDGSPSGPRRMPTSLWTSSSTREFPGSS